MDQAPEEVVRRCLDEGRAAWPEVAAPESALAPLLARDPAEVQFPADLFLASAAALGDPAAVAVLDHLLGELARVAGSGIVGGAGVEDLAQEIRTRLLVAQSGSLPRIADYRGRGPLRAWLRVTVVRAAISTRRSERVSPVDEADWLSLPAVSADPALHALQRRAAPAFRAAFTAALDELNPRQRTLLRQHFIDGLSSADLGALSRVHRVTIYRRIAEIKQELLELVRAELAETLGVGPQEIESLMRVVRSQFSLSLERVLATPMA